MSYRVDDWRGWIIKRQKGIHDHEAIRYDGSRAACPVWDCHEELSLTTVDLKKRSKAEKRRLAA